MNGRVAAAVGLWRLFFEIGHWHSDFPIDRMPEVAGRSPLLPRGLRRLSHHGSDSRGAPRLRLMSRAAGPLPRASDDRQLPANVELDDLIQVGMIGPSRRII